jgi:phosphoribosyl 1,2-cyclic phosphodiesterase
MPSGADPRLTFYGVRGSTPCSSDELRRYGGNTSCVVLEADDQAPIVLDMGTGLRQFGADWGHVRPVEATLLVTHMHWDHVQGLPFFNPIHHHNSVVKIYGPPTGSSSLRETFDGMMRPPYFPICCDELPRGVEFIDARRESFVVGHAKIVAGDVPHVGQTNGYRIEVGGMIIAYLPDHQEPVGRPDHVASSVLELCDGADVLIHDAQFTPEEFAIRPQWGHCTPRYALEVAHQAGVDRLVLFHHDPWHDDDTIDTLAGVCREEAHDLGVHDVIAAAEGMVIRP